MVAKIGRLCFEMATKSIGICNARGIKLNIAEMLRFLYSDEVFLNLFSRF